MNRTVSLRTYLLTLIVVSLIALTGVGYVLSQSEPFTIAPGVYPGAPSFTVWVDGSTYYAKDSYGRIAYSGTNASQITQSALNALTVGRTKPETVALKGVFDDVGLISLPSYVIFDLRDAQLNMKAPFDYPLIKNSDQVSGNVYITILGGRLDGNNASQSSTDARGINFKKVGKFWITDVVMVRFRGATIFLDCCYDGFITNNVIFDSYCGIHTYGEQTDLIISNNHLTGNKYNGIKIEGTPDGSQIATRVSIVGNIAQGNGYNGINLYHYVMDTTVTGNVLVSNGHDGIMAENETNYLTITGNVADNNGLSGITVYGGYYVTISGNTVKNNEQNGISLKNVGYSVISGNIAEDDQGSPTQQWGIREWQNGGTSNWNIITGAFTRGNAVGGVSVVGANTKVTSSYNHTNWIS